MRWYVTVFALVCLFVIAASLCVEPSFLGRFEESAVLSAGLVTGEKRFPEILFDAPIAGGKEASAEPIGKGVSEGEEPVLDERMPDEAGTTEGADATDRPEDPAPAEDSLFTRGGECTIDVTEGFSAEVTAEARRKISASAGDGVDLALFAAEGGIPPLETALNEWELAYVISEMIPSYMRSLSLGAELMSISFTAEGDRVRVEMRIRLSFDEADVKVLSFASLPSVVIRSRGDIYLKNSEISVDSEDISLECENYRIARSLFLWACKKVLKIADPQAAVAAVLKNVFVNAGISR